MHRIWPMKYSELHRRFVKAGWTFDHAEGSHYFYTKNGVMTEPIPYHGSHEIGKGLANKLKCIGYEKDYHDGREVKGLL